MSQDSPPLPFPPLADESLASEYQAIHAWIGDSETHDPSRSRFRNLDLKSLPSGAILIAGDAEKSRRIVMTAVALHKHWDTLIDRILDERRKLTVADYQYRNSELDYLIWIRKHPIAIINTLIKRNLAFARADLFSLFEWMSVLSLGKYNLWIPNAIAKAVSRYLSANRLDAELLEGLRKITDHLARSMERPVQRIATTIEQIYSSVLPDPSPESESAVPTLPRPQPAMVGTPLVLHPLKKACGIVPGSPSPPTILLEPDMFPMLEDSPLRSEHEFLSAFFREATGARLYSQQHLTDFETGRRLLELEPIERGRVLLANAERDINKFFFNSTRPEESFRQARDLAASLARVLLETSFVLDRNGKFDLALYLLLTTLFDVSSIGEKCNELIKEIKQDAGFTSLTEGERYILSVYRSSIVRRPLMGNPPDQVARLTKLINDGASFFLAPGEVWSDAVNEFVTDLEFGKRKKWVDFLRHTLTATTSRPAAKWLKTARQLIDDIGILELRAVFLRWLPLVAKGQTLRRYGKYNSSYYRAGNDTISDENAFCLRGFLWCVPMLPEPDELTRLVTAVAISAYKKAPGIGPREPKVGNAAVYALSEISSREAVGQLALLKVRVKFGTAQKEIEKAFDASANALGLPRDQIEELGVPSYGLEEVGRLSEELGNYRVELIVDSSHAELHWSDGNGKNLKSPPAKVKSDHKEEFKELQQSLKDIRLMLPAQRDRIDSMFLLQKSWPFEEWRTCYLDHPLVGTITRRLIWRVDGVPAIFPNGLALDVEGKELRLGKTSEITLWHPIDQGVEEITRWRARLETLQITQPFKQAHREIYLLTDAERNTRTYSNRFAAHVIRQHQFNALCAARGWKHNLRVSADIAIPPAFKELKEWGLRAEFWIGGIAEDSSDLNDSNVFLRLSTDQVRFYRLGAATNSAHACGGHYSSNASNPGPNNINEPIPLEEVPLLVFSEIMRDVDLFVGVASIGNDTNWQDGGPQRRYQDYWNRISFGELSNSAVTRRQTLERLVPRLKIASKCSFSDRFLVVRGQKRTYKIHLGSGNILMEPNDHYLCIVPDSRANAIPAGLHLPFEGDTTLSIIISKAFLLADDSKIKDPSITKQIGGI